MRKMLKLMVAGLALHVGAPVSAATLAGTEQVWQGGAWAVESTPYWCRAYPVAAEKNADGIPAVALVQWDGKVYLEFASAPETQQFSREISISTLKIDDRRHDVLTQHRRKLAWEAGIVNENTIAAIARGKELKSQLVGENWESFSLKGSAKAIVALAECANKLATNGIAGLDPMSRIEPNQKLEVKGNPGNWVPASAWPIGCSLSGMEKFDAGFWTILRPNEPCCRDGIRPGTVTFVLTVGKEGRAVKCEETSNTGDYRLNGLTCQNLVRRAKFKPATDAYGYVAESEYSNKVRWVIPK